MKSFSQFLISEELPVDDIEGRARTGRVIKKLQKKGKKISDADRARLDDARLKEIERDAVGKQGEQIRKSVVKSQGQDDLLDKINKNKERPVKSSDKFFGKPTGVDVKTGKAKYVPPKEIEGRSQYIDPKTNKASEKGIKSYINKARQMRTGSNVPVDSKTTDSIAKFSKSEYETKINQKYGGRRAKRASSNAPSLDAVQSKINKAEYAKILKKKNTSDFSKFSKKASEIKRKFTPQNTNPDLFKRMNMGAAGEDSNVSGSQPITKSKTTSTPTSASGKNLYKPHQTPGGTNITTNTSLSKGVSGSKTTGMDSNVSGSKTTTKPVIKNTKVDGKTFKSFSKKGNVSKLKISSLASPLVKKGLVGWSAYDNYKAAKGSPLRKAVKSAVTTAAYYKGFGAGATLGTGFGAVTGPGAVVTGTAGGIMGGDLAQKTAGSLFNKVWKPPTKTKTKTSSTTNNKGVGGNGKKDMKWTPMRGGVRLGSGPD